MIVDNIFSKILNLIKSSLVYPNANISGHNSVVDDYFGAIGPPGTGGPSGTGEPLALLGPPRHCWAPRHCWGPQALFWAPPRHWWAPWHWWPLGTGGPAGWLASVPQSPLLDTRDPGSRGKTTEEENQVRIVKKY